MTDWRRLRRITLPIIGIVLLPWGLHFGLRALARPTPPTLTTKPLEPIETSKDARRLGRSEVTFQKELTLARLVGTPEEIGVAHTRLLYDAILETEQRFYSRFQQYVPRPLARHLLLDLAQLRFFDIDEGMSLERRREIAAMAATLRPDPFVDLFPTYQRLIYLNAIYDISLSFEQSPLLGCTTLFTAAIPERSQHTLLARNFDFEVDPVFDEKKTLFIVKETGKIPYLSLAWPGLIGTVTGVNQRGLTVVVHGGRAGELSRHGEPVLHVLRDVLGKAENVEEAYAEIQTHSIMVSHILIVADPSGRAEVLERVPGRPTYRYRLGERSAVTNHLVGPSADDPKNRRVIEGTTTLERQRRGQRLLASHSAPLTAADLLGFLRDRKGVNGEPLSLGDRRALSALIAAHGVVVDLTEKRVWIGGTPTLLGPFYGLSIDDLFDDKKSLSALLESAPRLAADPLLATEEYAKFRAEHPR